MASSAASTASGAKPPLLASLATFTCKSASTTRPCAAARRSNSRASSRRSSEWMRSNSSSASLTLLVCRWPIRCHGTGRPSSAILSLASWTRFSPSAADAGGECGADALDLDDLGHADQQDVLGPAPGALGGARDPLAHTLEVRRDIEHARF